MFVSIEGSNGVGKTSVIQQVCMKLKQKEISYFTTKEPTNSFLGNFARESESKLSGITYACLIASDRYYHLEHEIFPSLKKFDVVISDRYVESSLVLQSLDGVEREFIWDINSRVIIPNLSIILISKKEILENRLDNRSKLSRFEKEFTRTQEQNLYLEIADFLTTKGYNIVIVENTDLNDTANTICELIENLFLV